MSKNVVIGAVVVLVIIAGAWFFLSPKQQTPTESAQPVQTFTQAPTESPTPQATQAATTGKTVVKISADGFSPKSVTIKVGESVTWENTDSANHTVNSDPHPTHTLFPILNQVGLIGPGESKSLTFTKAGTYTYHDHLNPSSKGTVIVK